MLHTVCYNTDIYKLRIIPPPYTSIYNLLSPQRQSVDFHYPILGLFAIPAGIIWAVCSIERISFIFVQFAPPIPWLTAHLVLSASIKQPVNPSVLDKSHRFYNHRVTILIEHPPRSRLHSHFNISAEEFKFYLVIFYPRSCTRMASETKLQNSGNKAPVALPTSGLPPTSPTISMETILSGVMGAR